jgi:AhpD family alkylhydroperoxidase
MLDTESRMEEYRTVSPEPYKAMLALEAYLHRSGLEPPLLELVRMRVSQINGCAFCLNMHSRLAIAGGESPRRLFQLDAWDESPVFTDRERAALKWADAVTQAATSRVPDEAYQKAREQFSEKELVDLTWAIVAINGWNRLSISFRVPPEDR